MHRGGRRQSVRSGSGNYSCHRQPALTGRQVISSGEWLEEDLRFDRFGGFLAQPERPRFRCEDGRHAVVKAMQDVASKFPDDLDIQTLTAEAMMNTKSREYPGD